MKSFGTKPAPTEDIVEIDAKNVSYTCIYRSFDPSGQRKPLTMIHSASGKARERSIFPTASDLHFDRDLTKLRKPLFAFGQIGKKPTVKTAQCAIIMTPREDAISAPSG